MVCTSQKNRFHYPERMIRLKMRFHYIESEKNEGMVLHLTVTLATYKRRQFLKEIAIRWKICFPSSNNFLIKVSLPLEGIIGSTFRKKWKIKTMVFSKSIISSHYKVLGFTWLFYFRFTEKCVTLEQDVYSKLFCFHVLGKSQLFLPCIWIVCADS